MKTASFLPLLVAAVLHLSQAVDGVCDMRFTFGKELIQLVTLQPPTQERSKYPSCNDVLNKEGVRSFTPITQNFLCQTSPVDNIQQRDPLRGGGPVNSRDMKIAESLFSVFSEKTLDKKNKKNTTMTFDADVQTRPTIAQIQNYLRPDPKTTVEKVRRSKFQKSFVFYSTVITGYEYYKSTGFREPHHLLKTLEGENTEVFALHDYTGFTLKLNDIHKVMGETQTIVVLVDKPGFEKYKHSLNNSALSVKTVTAAVSPKPRLRKKSK